MGGAGNRQDQRARGNAPQLLEKYKALARDAQMAGDRVQTEYYLQFADHYFRVVSETRARFEDQRPRREEVQSDDDYDDEDGNELNADEAAEPRREQPQQREVRPERADREERFRGREDRPRGDRPRRDRDGERGGYAARSGGGEDMDEAPEGVADGVSSLDLDRLPPAIARPVMADDEDEEAPEVQAVERDEPEDDRPRRTRRPRRPREGAPVAA